MTKWERIESSDPQWWSKTLSLGSDIEQLIQKQGPFFWKIATFDDGEIRVLRILQVDAGTLYYLSDHSDKIPVRMIREMVKDRVAEKEWTALPDSGSKGKFEKEWTGRSTFKRKDWV